MIKNPLYQIFKISSTRFAENNFQINLSYEQAVINQEVVSLSSSEMLRALRRILDYSEDHTFIKEYVAVSIDMKSHYKEMKSKGITVNGVHFKRFLCGASNARNETVFFIAENIYDQMFEIMSCGINMQGKSMILAKWNAYFALNASSSYPVTEPRAIVIPDYGMDITHEFEFVDKYKSIEHKEMTVEDYCVWDGMGVMSCQYAEKVGHELQLGYTPSSVVIRASFVKGALFTMDINRFIEEKCEGKDIIKDIYGNEHHAKDVDVILTKSQFKMSKMYKSWDQYLENMHKYQLGWGVTLVSHGVDDAHAFTNYQFLQVLNLDDKQIEGICSKTIDWLGHVIGSDIMSTILYMAGTKPINLDSYENQENQENQDYALLSLIYNNDMINDSYIRNRIIRSLNKRIRQAYSGKLLMNGNFSFVCCDPYAFLEYAFGKTPNGLLGSNQYYSGFWNRRGVHTICAMRSPLTWVSENNTLNLVENDILDDWYKYIQNGVIILNRWGVDTFKFADSDYDGDKLFTTDQVEMISGKDKKYNDPVTYTKEAAPESKWSEKRLYDIDYLSFGSKIGFVTNCSTYWYSLRSNFSEGTIEYEELTKRLVWSRYQQGTQIDKTKGIRCEPSPKEWVKNTKKSTDLDKELVVCRKPYFQKYIYPRLNKEYKEWQCKIERYSISYYGVSADQNEDEEFIRIAESTCPVLDNNSVMNRICHYMESHIREVKTARKDFNQIQLDSIMMNNYRELRLDKESYIRNCLARYKELRKAYRENTKFVSREEKASERQQFYMYCETLRNEILLEFDGSAVDAANMAIYVGYENNTQENREFAWELFGKEIFNNVKSNRQENVYVPEPDANGDIKYLGMRYSRKKVD